MQTSKKRFYLFLERGEEREKEREKNTYVQRETSVASCMPPTVELAHYPGIRPGWESNLWIFSLQAGAQPTKPHHQGGEMQTFQWKVAVHWNPHGKKIKLDYYYLILYSPKFPRWIQDLIVKGKTNVLKKLI